MNRVIKRFAHALTKNEYDYIIGMLLLRYFMSV